MTLLLIDGDVVAYLACKPRLKTTETGQYEITPKGEKLPIFSEREDSEYFKKCWVEFNKIIDDLRETLFSDYYKMAVKGKSNFRDELFEGYKAHRKNTARNKFVPMLRSKAVEEGMAVEADNMEADDCLRIWAEEARNKGTPFIVCSVDKDLKCIVGSHFNLKKNIFSKVTEWEATKFFYEQVLQGDPTDGIKGLPGIGPAKAQAMLDGLETEEELQFTVAMFYFEFFGSRWKEELILNGSLLYLLKSHADKFTIDSWNIPEEILSMEDVSEEHSSIIEEVTNELPKSFSIGISFNAASPTPKKFKVPED